MALHELFNKENAGEELDIQISTEPMSNRFKAEVKYQGKVYAGLGKWFYYKVVHIAVVDK